MISRAPIGVGPRSVSLLCVLPSLSRSGITTRRMSAESTVTSAPPSGGPSPVVQYIVIRKDIKWPLGAVAAQAAHSAVAAIWQSKDDPVTQAYCSPEAIDRMHKVCLGIESQPALEELSKALTEGGIKHKLWVEQPENTPVSLATKPYSKEEVSSFFIGLKLLR
jgi:peptidyl-tRNA hydrolase